MLIGAHVSPAGGPAKAVQRGLDLGCRSIQIFNQSPRAWRTRRYSETEVTDFRKAMDESVIDALVIHAVYLINCASLDPDIGRKSQECLNSAMQAGDILGAKSVVLHPGSALKNGGPAKEAIVRAAERFRIALAESENCELHFENTAGAGGTLGRSFEELAELIEQPGSDSRLGVCLDSCHLYASGFDVSTVEGLSTVLDEFDAKVGLERLRCIHLNDSATALGSNRDRHADLGMGYLGEEGAIAFLSEPRLEGLPCIMETPGPDGKGPLKDDMTHAFRLRQEGLKRRH